MSFTFLHRPKPKKFGYKPVFYKMEEEDVDDKKRRIINPKENKELDLKDKIKKSWGRELRHSSISQENILRTIVVLVLLILTIFFVKIG